VQLQFRRLGDDDDDDDARMSLLTSPRPARARERERQPPRRAISAANCACHTTAADGERERFPSVFDIDPIFDGPRAKLFRCGVGDGGVRLPVSGRADAGMMQRQEAARIATTTTTTTTSPRL